MNKEFDLKKMKSRKNPYANRLKKQITIRLDNSTIEYFKELSKETGFSYQALINLYLRDCAENRKKPKVTWIESSHPH
ncbi:BrnA antitoxin family protein [Acidobacteriota bacterium]